MWEINVIQYCYKQNKEFLFLLTVITLCIIYVKKT